MNHYKVLFLLVFSLIVFTPQTQAALTMGATTLTSDGVLTVTTTGGLSVGASGLQAAVGVQGAAATAGTGTISSSATTVTGTGTAFSTDVSVGDLITGSSEARIVTAVSSDTAMEVTGGGIDTDPAAWSGATYTIQKPSLKIKDSAGNPALIVAGDGTVNMLGQVSIGNYEHMEDKLVVRKDDSSWWSAIRADRRITLSGATNKQNIAMRAESFVTSTAGAYTGTITSFYGISRFTGSGTATGNSVVGINSENSNAGSTTLTNIIGFTTIVNNTSTGTITNGYGYKTSAANSGGGTYTNYYGYSSAAKPATITNYYHFYGGTGGYSYLPHNVGIGAGVSTTPTAYLQLGAGTATASTAPLKFTTGTNLTVAEAGAVEYDGTNLFYTDGTATRRTVANRLTNTATIDFASIAAQTCINNTITVTGAVANDAVAVGAPTAIEAGLSISGYVSVADTVTVRLCNVTSGAVDPASATFRASVIR